MRLHFFFKALPNKSLLGPNEQADGLKTSKERFSLLVCANAIDEKEKLLVIGKAKHPHNFPNYNSDLEQHTTYRNNKHGWMTTAVFTEFLNKLNNKTRRQNLHILMFLDNCSSHPHLALSNIQLCFYPKNTTSQLQAMDQGVIANLKQKYNKCMLNMARIKAKSATKVKDIIRDIKIFNAILHAWESINPETIKNCFRRSGAQESYACLPPTTPVDDAIDDDPEFAQFFQDLLDVAWDEYLAMDAELEQENPSRALDAQSYNNDNTCLQECQHDEPTIISHDDALDHLHRIQKSNLEDIKLFELLEHAMNHLQSKKMTTEITNKSK